MPSTIRILFIGDVIGRPGRELVAGFLPEFKRARNIDFVIVNGENAAGGRGLTLSVARELYKAGANVLTGGNHIWKNREILEFIDEDPRVIRPANYPTDAEIPGRGAGLYDIPGTDARIAVINLLGRVFMEPMDCPFRIGRSLAEQMKRETPLVFVDMHAEATSEKIALAWHLDGLATAVIGTHTHVQTADENITLRGTATLTDAGMTGPYDGVLGIRKEIILHHMITGLPVRHELAADDLRLCGVLIEADPQTGRALSIERICHRKPAQS